MDAALASVLAGPWAEVVEDRELLVVEFELRDPSEFPMPGGLPILPWRGLLPPRHTSTFTFLHREVSPGAVAIPPLKVEIGA